MIGSDDLTELGPVLVALDAILYPIEDTLTDIAKAAYAHGDNAVAGLFDRLDPVVAAAYDAASINLPGEPEAGPLDWSAVEQASAMADSQLTATEAKLAGVVTSATEHVNALADALLPSATDLLESLVRVISDLIGGLLGNLTDTEDLWTDLYTILREKFGQDIDPITQATFSIVDGLLANAAERWQADDGLAARLTQGAGSARTNSPVTVEDYIRGLENQPRLVKAVFNLGSLAAGFISILNARMAGYLSGLTQASLAESLTTPLSSAELAELTRRNDVTREWATDEAKRSGVSPEMFDLKYLLTQRLLSTDQLLDLWRRTGDDNVLDDLYRSGFATQDVERLRTLALAVATPPDVVRFMARDVTDPSAIAFGGLDVDFEKKYDKALFDAAGVSESLAKLFWMAHWSLPSPTMGYEMLHRGILNDTELEELLKLADYAPGWVAKMKAISYNVPGRIDVRRMWETGIITDRAALEKRYRDMGYSPADAVTIADFTEALAAKSKEAAAERDRGPIIRAIVQEYAHGIISDTDAQGSLVSLGITPERAEYRLREGDFEREQDRATRIRTALGRQYIRGFATDVEVSSRLSVYGFGSAEIDSLLDSWRLDRELAEESAEKQHAKDLTKSETLHSFSERLITREQAHASLVALGYDTDESETLIRLEEVKQQKADARVVEQAIHTQFLARRITASEAQNTLAGFGYLPERIAALLARWQVEQEERRPEVSNAQLERMLYEGLIPEDQLADELARRGYTDRDVHWLRTLYGAKMATSQDALQEKIREFDIRETRLGRQGDTRIDLTRRAQDIGVARFDQQQSGIQQRFESAQEQTARLQQARLDAASAATSARIAAQTARDAATFAAGRERQERQIQATQEQLDKRLAQQESLAQQAATLRQAALDQQRDLRAQAEAATDARQTRSLQSQADRLERTIQAQTDRATQAQNAAAALQIQRQDAAREIVDVRAHIQEARDIRLNAERIAAENRAAVTKVQVETRAAARKEIAAADAAQSASELTSLQLSQSADVAELNARYARLQAQIATQRQQQALSARQAAERLLAAATPATTLLDTAGF